MNIQFKPMLSFLLLFNIGYFILSLPSDSSEVYCSINSIDGCKGSKEVSDKFYESFYGNGGFLDDSITFTNHVKSYFGVTGYRDKNMHKDALSLWKRFELESSKQSSGPRKYTQDIPNGFNGSLLKF